MARQIPEEQLGEAMDCLYAIEAVAQLMQRAHERTEPNSEGIFGGASIIEQNVQKLYALMGEE